MLSVRLLALGSESLRSLTRKTVLALSAACLCLVGLAASAQAPISGKPVPSLSQLDTIMQTYMTQYSSPGATLAVTVDGRLVYARGYGYAKVDTGEFVQPDSLFRIASNSKPITAAGIYKLIEQGKLSLTTQPFATILAGLTPPPGSTVDPRYANITIQELLQHTAGFDDTIVPDPAFAYPVTAATAFGAPAPATPQLLIKYMLGQPLQHDPGTTYAYSNFGYITLGYIIEQVSGEPYAKYIQENVFATAGIVRTQPGASLLSGRLPDEVTYYDYPGAPLVASVEQPVGVMVPFPYGGYSCTLNLANGCWVSSTLDLLRFTDSINGQFPTPMFTTYPSSTPFRSPQFYFAIPPNGPGWEYVFYGSLPGTNSLVHLFTNGATTGKVTYSAIFNTRDGSNIEQPESDADNAIATYVKTVTAWPSGDLFANYQGTASSCSFTLAAQSQSATANGGSMTVQLTDANYCAWSAVTTDSWLHVTAGALNSDSGQVAYTVDANTGGPRTGTIAIAGQTFTVTQAGTTTPTALVVSANTASVHVGQPVMLTATLTPSSAGSASTNGETITFSSGATSLGSATLSGGVATLTTSSLPAGTDSITASYAGDTTFSASTAAGVPVVVSSAPTTLALAATPTAATTGQSVVLTATLSPFSAGAVSTDGEKVTFSSGTTSLGTATLTGGVATLTTTSLPAGTDSITASYAGDTNFGASSAAGVQVVVTQSTTTVVLTSSAASVFTGSSLTFTATVTGKAGSPAPTGVVTFNDGATALGTGTISSGVATLMTGSLSMGMHTITATYAGDSNNMASASSAVTVTVLAPTGTTTVVTSSAPTAVANTSLTFTATVAGTAGTPAATGTVTFTDGSTTLGTGTLGSGGTATYTTSALAVGTHSITATYAGDADNTGSVSAAITVTVTAPPPDYTISFNPSSATVHSGKTVTTVITLTPENGFNTATTFSCSGLPVNATCAFNPATLTPNGAPVTSTLTIATGVKPVATASLTEPGNMPGARQGSLLARLSLAGSGAMVAMLFWPGLLDRKRRTAWLRLMGVVLLAAVAIQTVTGCGSSSKNSTPKGNSTIMVTATAGTATHTASFTLTVQ